MSHDQTERLLVVTNDPAAEKALRPRLEELADERELEVKIVAPMQPSSGLDLFTGDVDDSIAAAGDQADRSATETDRAEAAQATQVEVGDADKMLAIEDALATFKADRIVLVAPEDDLLGEAREHFHIPVIELEAG